MHIRFDRIETDTMPAEKRVPFLSNRDSPRDYVFSAKIIQRSPLISIMHDCGKTYFTHAEQSPDASSSQRNSRTIDQCYRDL
jgi:hypothetical protein